MLLLLLQLGPVRAVEIGDSRDALISELGDPSSEAQAGNRAILGFKNGGRAVLIDGRVTRYSVDMLPTPVPTVQRVVLHSKYTKDIDLGKFSWKKLLIAGGFALFVGLLTFRIFFTGVDDLIESERYSLQPNWISWWRGEYWEDLSATAKLNLWTAVILIAGAGAYTFLSAFDFLIK